MPFWFLPRRFIHLYFSLCFWDMKQLVKTSESNFDWCFDGFCFTSVWPLQLNGCSLSSHCYTSEVQSFRATLCIVQPLTFPKILICEEWAIIIVYNTVLLHSCSFYCHSVCQCHFAFGTVYLNDAAFQCYYTPRPTPIYTGGGGLLESLCPSVVLSMCLIMSAQYLLNCSTIFFFF